MEITLRTNYSIAELIVTSDNTTIKEDASTYQASPKGYAIPNDQIDQFIDVARDCFSFNNKSDIEFCKAVISRFLTDGELERLIVDLTEEV